MYSLIHREIIMRLSHIKDEVVFDGKYTQMILRHVLSKSGKPIVWEMVRRKTHGRIVAIVPVTIKKEVVLVKIYRVPVQSYVIEACAGLMDVRGESEEDAARREMLEETGFQSEKIERIVSGSFNSGLLADEIVYFIARNAKKVSDPKLEDAEDLEVVRIPLEKLESFLEHPPDNAKVDVKLFGILYFLKKIFLQ